jgi:hypothetical protein
MQVKARILLLVQVALIAAIEIQLVKRNVYIPQNSHYLSSLELQREDAELVPTTLELQTTITSTIPKFGDYFDYFYYLTPRDLECYQDAVQNESYLFPCPFLRNHYSKNRVSEVQSLPITQEIDNINDVKFSFVIDNTLFPSPEGAYSYSGINVDVVTTLDITVSSSYQILGKRLIFINATMMLISLVIIVTIIYKTQTISRKMDISKRDSNRDNRSPFIDSEEDYDDSFLSDEEGEMESVAVKGEIVQSASYRGSQANTERVKSGILKFLTHQEDESD